MNRRARNWLVVNVVMWIFIMAFVLDYVPSRIFALGVTVYLLAIAADLIQTNGEIRRIISKAKEHDHDCER